MNIMRHVALLLLLLAAARLGDARQQPQSHLSANPVQVAAIRSKRQSQPTDKPTESEEGHEELEILMGDTLRNKHFYGGSQTAADISKAVAKRLDPIDGYYAIVARNKNEGKLPDDFKPPKSFTLLLGDVPRGTELIFKPDRDDQGNVRYQSEDTFTALEYSRNKKGVYKFQGETETKLELPEGFVENAEDTGDMRLNHFQSDDTKRGFVDARAAKFDRNEMTETLRDELRVRYIKRNQYNKSPRSVHPPERPNPHSRPRGSSSERTKSAEDSRDFSENHTQLRESSSCSSARNKYSRSSARSTPSCSSDDAPNRKRRFPENDRDGDDANQEAKEANDANNDGVNDNDNGNDNDNENDGNYERGD